MDRSGYITVQYSRGAGAYLGANEYGYQIDVLVICLKSIRVNDSLQAEQYLPIFMFYNTSTVIVNSLKMAIGMALVEILARKSAGDTP